MDCLVPSHSVRTFCSAIGCLSRIGKDLYVEFDAEDGLITRTLNDAKSAFASFHWRPSFFERCFAPPPPSYRKRRSQRQQSDDAVWSCQVPLRALAAVVKPRRGVLSLRVRSEVSASDHSLYLTFEFRLEKQNDLLRVVHRIGVADAEGVSPVAPKDDCSEIVAAPRLLLRMLEPLKRTSEVSMIVNDRNKLVTMKSFHHNDTATSTNSVLQASSASLLKTETSIGVDEFEEFDFRGNRATDDDSEPTGNMEEEVTLVFGIKESKAMLNFCVQNRMDHELRVAISFHWGGKPIIFETECSSFKGELIMATLDHELVRPSTKRASSSQPKAAGNRKGQ